MEDLLASKDFQQFHLIFVRVVIRAPGGRRRLEAPVAMGGEQRGRAPTAARARSSERTGSNTARAARPWTSNSTRSPTIARGGMTTSVTAPPDTHVKRPARADTSQWKWLSCPDSARSHGRTNVSNTSRSDPSASTTDKSS